MAKTETEKKNKTQGEKPKTKDDDTAKKGRKKGGKKKEIKYQPGMSYLYEPCPHRVWTPKPGERDKSEPRGVGSPWYEPVRKKEEIDKEEDEKRKKKEEKAAGKRQQAYDERQKKKEEEEKNRKEEEKKNEEKAKKKEEEKKKKEKQKKKKENEKRKKQEEQRKKEKEKKKKEEGEGKGKQKGKKEEEKLQASYMYEPCPHKVYTPSPGERDMADPRGVGSPWYVPIRKKEDIDKEEAEREEQDKQKRKEDQKKRQEEKKKLYEMEEEDRKLEEEKRAKEERKIQKRREEKRKEIEDRREQRALEDLDHEEMGMGARESRTDFTPELIWMMDFITDVDEKERERRGDALRWKKQEIEEDIETHLAKEAYMNDFKEIVSTFVEAEWSRADKKLKKLEKDERRKRRKMLKNMDSLPKDLFMEAKRFKTLYKAATGQKGKGEGEGPSALEDKMVGMIMQQMDTLDSSQLDMFSGLLFK